MPNRYDLDAEMSEARKPIDAGWSPKKKKIVGAACATVAVGVLAAGAWVATATAAPSLPTTAAEAVAVMSSDRFNSLDPERKRQYATEAGRLIRGLSDEERRTLLRDDKNRDAMRKLWEEMSDEMARRIARGEQVERPGPPAGARPPAGDRPPREELTAEQRAERMEERRQEMNKRFTESLASGNSQSGALRAEMFKKFFSQGGGRGGGGPRGGGGGGGGPRGGGGGGGGRGG